MSLFDVYPRFDVTLTKGRGSYVYDRDGTKYLDLYGGHGVISIGHSHPKFVEAITKQADQLVYYSNSVLMPIQEQLAEKLSLISGYPDHQLFLCNSGSEANENALKIASFHTGRTKVIAYNNSFHGRTAASLNVTFNQKISAPINKNNFEVVFLDLNDAEKLESQLKAEDVCAVIVEGIQGVGGLDHPSNQYLKTLEVLCKKYGTLLIADEIQSGFGRTGDFFAHQQSGVSADLVTMAKGMGNGIPVGGVMIHPDIKPWHGMLGTTFGGNPLACAASLSVIGAIEKQQLMKNANTLGQQLKQKFSEIDGIVKVKGRGLMLGLELTEPVKDLRKELLFQHHCLTGGSANPNLLRILPPLTISEDEITPFITSLKKLLNEEIYSV